MHNVSYLTIKQVCRETGLVSSTLRYWEKEFDGILVPLRTNGGQRRYDHKSLAVIKEIKTMRDRGISLVEIKKTLMNGNGFKGHVEIELLANRVAEMVKLEIYNYFSHEK